MTKRIMAPDEYAAYQARIKAIRRGDKFTTGDVFGVRSEYLKSISDLPKEAKKKFGKYGRRR